MIDLIIVPMARGGSVVLLINKIGGAVTNRENPDYTDVYAEPFVEPVTIDMDVDAFGELWFTALTGETDLVDEYHTYPATAVH